MVEGMMDQSANSAYLESRILSASSVELILILYEAALEAVGAARRALALGDVKQRSRQVVKAVEILSELSRSLDHSHEEKLSARLAAIYDYMQRTLLEANYRQEDAGLAEAERLLQPLLAGWSQIARPSPPVSAAAATASAYAGLPQESLSNGWSA